MKICNKCKNEFESNHLEKIDGVLMCHSCLYQNHEPFKIYPIGFVENQLERAGTFGVKGNKTQVSIIHLFESQRLFLYKLEDEEWITIVYYLHDQHEIRSTFSRGIDSKTVGIFASRTPDRLSRIGISNVNLVKIQETNVFVKNLDAIDGTPVLDIKLGEKSRW